jgi:hypothetical protein
MKPEFFAILLVVFGAGVALADPPDECRPLLPRWALPSSTGHYLGYYLGGGAGHSAKAEPRRVEEGTWGWDYQGWLLPRRVVLGWWHGRRYQGGTGAYSTEGPLLYQPGNAAK